MHSDTSRRSTDATLQFLLVIQAFDVTDIASWSGILVKGHAFRLSHDFGSLIEQDSNKRATFFKKLKIILKL